MVLKNKTLNLRCPVQSTGITWIRSDYLQQHHRLKKMKKTQTNENKAKLFFENIVKDNRHLLSEITPEKISLTRTSALKLK